MTKGLPIISSRRLKLSLQCLPACLPTRSFYPPTQTSRNKCQPTKDYAEFNPRPWWPAVDCFSNFSSHTHQNNQTSSNAAKPSCKCSPTCNRGLCTETTCAAAILHHALPACPALAHVQCPTLYSIILHRSMPAVAILQRLHALLKHICAG
jgi:hypothetical protein